MAETSFPKVGGILLAAGGSRRLGQPKQLLQFKGSTLIRNAAESLCSAGLSTVVAVIGAESDKCTAALEGLAITMVVNSDWTEGMGSSIRVGLAALLRLQPDIEAIVISLCDQPFIDSEMLRRFPARYYETQSAVIATRYDDTIGVPALFSREMFVRLSAIEGDKGARELIRNHRSTETIDLPKAAFDIDTPQNLAILEID